MGQELVNPFTTLQRQQTPGWTKKGMSVLFLNFLCSSNYSLLKIGFMLWHLVVNYCCSVTFGSNRKPSSASAGSRMAESFYMATPFPTLLRYPHNHEYLGIFFYFGKTHGVNDIPLTAGSSNTGRRPSREENCGTCSYRTAMRIELYILLEILELLLWPLGFL